MQNASFENGLWQKNVSDCRNYDSLGKVEMALSENDSTNGKNSLALTSFRHDACTNTKVNIQGNTSYDLSFDYKGPAGEFYGFAVEFDNQEKTLHYKKLPIPTKDGWQHKEEKVMAPSDATTATIYLYSYESEGKQKSIVSYDKVKLYQSPDYNERYYVVEGDKGVNSSPSFVKYISKTESKKDVYVTNATKPFYLLLSETYHDKWQLGTNEKNLDKSNHIKLNGYMNAWYVEPDSFCNNPRANCAANSLGGYDIQLSATFSPQKWFQIASAISWLTLSLGLLYVCTYGNRRKLFSKHTVKTWKLRR